VVDVSNPNVTSYIPVAAAATAANAATVS